MTNQYFIARIKLTVLYTLIFGSFILLLSGILYHVFAQDIQEDMASIYQNNSVQVEIIRYHKTVIRNYILSWDLGIIIFIGLVSYYLSDMVLKPIEKNDIAQRRFTANASHELRTPIAILKTDLEVSILDKTIPSKFKHIFAGYLDELNNMKLIVENMLASFRLESHQQKINKQKFLLSKLILDNVAQMQSLAKSNEVVIKSKVAKNIYIKGDEFYLQLAVRNILKNAIEYSNGKGKVLVSLSKNKNIIELSISDNGIGIPKQMLVHIFDRVMRSEVSKSKRQEGTGLGLSITKNIIDLHQGKININSLEDMGTNVTIIL